VKGDFYGNALQAAAFESNEKVVVLLVSKVADVNAHDGEYGQRAAGGIGNALLHPFIP
jgi:hypothetical protein